jgi:glycosyltransferase involved in cell wall biosynthesis
MSATLHVCKFRAAAASRLQMQLQWDGGVVMDTDTQPSRVERYDLSYGVLYRLLRERRFSTVVFHMQPTVPHMLFAMAVRALLRLDVSLVYDIHDLNELLSGGPSYLKARFVAFWLLEGLVFSQADEVLTVSRGLARVYYRRYRRQPLVVYNAPPIDPRLADRGGTLQSGLVYFGIIDKVRLPRDLVESVLNAGMTIDAYGIVRAGDVEWDAFLERMVERGVIRLMGTYSPDNLDFLKRYEAALLVFEESEVNVRYCLPNKIFQAISRGLPCLLSHGLAEARIKFGRFPRFIYSLPRDRSRFAQFFAESRTPESPVGVANYVATLHRKSRERYLSCLRGFQPAEARSSCVE